MMNDLGLIISTTTNWELDNKLNRRPQFEAAFLERAKGQMGVTEGDLPAGVPEFLLRKRLQDNTYDLDNTQDLYIGWCLALEDGAVSDAANAYRAQLEAQVKSAQADVAQLKCQLQMTDPKFRRKVALTRVMRFLKRFL